MYTCTRHLSHTQRFCGLRGTVQFVPCQIVSLLLTSTQNMKVPQNRTISSLSFDVQCSFVVDKGPFSKNQDIKKYDLMDQRLILDQKLGNLSQYHLLKTILYQMK